MDNHLAGYSNTSVSDDLSWLAGGGEMGELIRAMDWSKTPLGPPQTWPQSLRTSVSLCLSSTFPILIAWGPQDIQIYNDSYRPICGAKHPESMGQNFKICWATALPVVGDAFDRAHLGEGTYIRDQRMFLDRYGYLEEAFMTFSFSPIRVESGEVGGVFHPISETTDKVLGARRTQGLRDLSAHIGKSRTIDEMCLLIAEKHPDLLLDLPFILFYELAEDGRAVRLRGAAGVAAGSALAPVQAKVDQPGSWPFSEVLTAASIVPVHDLTDRFGVFTCEPYPEAPGTALLLPVTIPGQARPAGFIVAGVSARRAIDADYTSFYELLMHAVNTAVGNITAYELEQKRAEALATIDRAKTAFFSNVSHEFRTPLTLILGPLEDALADRSEPLGTRQRDRIEVTHRNALRLLKLVNALLDFSRIEAGRVQAHYAPADLSALTADLASVFRAAMEKAGLAYQVNVDDLGEAVYVDRDMWEKIVFNLLSNAFKFTLKGSVSLALKRVGSRARLTVRDTGTGIQEAELPRVFERFHRIEGAQGRTYEGTGIGLALIQELVRLHGGEISVESRFGEGSAFHVDLPFGDAHLPADRITQEVEAAAANMTGASFVEEALRWLPDAPPSMHETATANTLSVMQDQDGGIKNEAPARILVADDNNDMRAYIRTLLEPHAVIETCTDGEAAFEAIRREPPDLLLSDVMMPRLDGFGLIREIRNDARLKDLPIILLSARAGEEAKVEGLQSGADDYLVKPFAAAELLARVQRQLSLSRQRRQARKSLEESEHYFRTLVDSSTALIWTTDVDALCTYLSKRWYEYTGSTPEQELGLGWMNNIHRDDRPIVEEKFAASHALREPFRLDYRLRQHDGQYRWMIDLGTPRFDEQGRFQGYVGTVIDVHESKTLEDAVRKVADDLAQVNRRQSEFLVTLAHELRNPLASIRNGLDIMELTAQDPVRLRQVQNIMKRQIDHMTRLVDDLLDLARITRGKISLDRQQVELQRVLRDAVEISMPQIDAGRHRLQVDMPQPPLILDIDPHRITQVVSNLLNNAAKYTAQGGQLSLSLIHDNTSVLIAVRDNGTGIPASMQDSIFEMFMQVESNAGRTQGGLGVGLHLVKRLVELHDGTVWVESDGPGQGSCFTVRLPMPENDSSAGGNMQAASVPGNRSLRALIVDDNVDATEILASLMDMSGHVASVAHDGGSAIASAAAFRPDIVFLDIGLPDMTGYEAVAQMREIPGLERTVFVALTGWGGDADRMQSQKAGFDHHLTKPASLDVILDIMSRI